MVNIFIGTPCFEYKVNVNYVNTLIFIIIKIYDKMKKIIQLDYK
jgi:hypothetical protein